MGNAAASVVQQCSACGEQRRPFKRMARRRLCLECYAELAEGDTTLAVASIFASCARLPGKAIDPRRDDDEMRACMGLPEIVYGDDDPDEYDE